MKRALTALVAGLLFGAGLALSGMADPYRVQAFLDIFGAWDPTLAFAMGGALIPMAAAWLVRRRLVKPLVADAFDLPSTRHVDAPLVIGSVLFGVGWGISGLCPGPAIAGLSLAPANAAVAVAAIMAGMALHRLTSRYSPGFYGVRP